MTTQNILAFDLANFSSSFALMKEGRVVDSFYALEFRGQDVNLLSRLKVMLTKHSLVFQDLDLVVTTAGPGSFTGIRVGLATAQGLSFAASVPAIALNSFQWVRDTYAFDTSLEKKTLVVLESMRKELYVQQFDESGEMQGKPFMATPQEILNLQISDDIIYLGNGASELSVAPLFMPDAKGLLQCAAAIDSKDYSTFPCEPFYMRNADISKAKPLFEKKSS